MTGTGAVVPLITIVGSIPSLLGQDTKPKNCTNAFHGSYTVTGGINQVVNITINKIVLSMQLEHLNNKS